MISDQYKLAKDTINCTLHKPIQEDGVYWMLSMENQVNGPKGGFLCDEMGIGKTVQTVATILGNVKTRTLIIVPKCIINQWMNEIGKFAPSLTILIYEKNKTINHDIVICSYHSIDDKLKRIKWDRLVLDEAHEIRNRKTKMFRNIAEIKADIRWGLTGTPIFNNMEDFVSLCMYLGFSKKIAQSMTDEIKSIYILRRKNKVNLPKCHYEDVEIDMTVYETNLYDFVYDECKRSMGEIIKSQISNNQKTMYFLENLLRIRQVMIHPQIYYDGIGKKTNTDIEEWTNKTNKFTQLSKFVDEHPNEKSLIFFQFIKEIDIIKSYINREIFVIKGDMSNDLRELELNNFTNASNGSVMLIQIKAGGQGLNIQCASRVYITSPAWNPATELQAIARSHRQGQTKEVYVKRIIYNNTHKSKSVDIAIKNLQRYKKCISNEILGDEMMTPGAKLNIDAIRKIFSV